MSFLNGFVNGILGLKYRGQSNSHIRNLLKIPLKYDDVVIDCGANIGKITSILARNSSRVYAFEPNPFAFKELCKKFSNNDRVTCFQTGVYDENTKTKLFLHEHSSQDQVLWSTGSSILSCKSNIDVNSYVNIELIDFCEFVSKLDVKIKLIKMDVEGAECAILLKMIYSGLIDQVDHIFVERHDHKIPELKLAMAEIESEIKSRKLTQIHLDWI